MHSLVIFASGRGSNARAIIDYFKSNPDVVVSAIVSNKPNAGVLDIAREENIPTYIVDKETFNNGELLTSLNKINPTFIILAGFLWRIPSDIVSAFPEQIVNIHPALLPKYGGKGMYGDHVHNAVLAAGEKETGITIHYVDEVYDNGSKLLQAHCVVHQDDSVSDVANRIHKLEHFFFPRTIEYLLDNI